MRRGIKAQKDGTYRVELPAEERDVLASLPGPLREALDAGEPTLYRSLGTYLLGMASGQDPGMINWPAQVRAAALAVGVTLP